MIDFDKISASLPKVPGYHFRLVPGTAQDRYYGRYWHVVLYKEHERTWWRWTRRKEVASRTVLRYPNHPEFAQAVIDAANDVFQAYQNWQQAGPKTRRFYKGAPLDL